MKKVILTLLLASFTNLISAQTIVELPVIRTASANDQPIELKRLNINVFVVENIATTTFEMEFYNNNDRIMEGELNFPLNNSVTISDFALDVRGEMRKGVVVEKERATQAFEAVTRRNIDPGIVEATKGNNFRVRVYPIAPKGYKKATIAFEQELRGENENFIYQLPVNLKHELEEFSVKVEVVMNKPRVRKSNHPSIDLTFTEERNSYISLYEANNVILDTQLAFSIPRPEKVHEVLTYKGEVTSDNYFYINLDPVVETRPKSRPSHITVIWDESSSGNNRDIQKELGILEGYLEWMQDGVIDLKTFSNTFHSEKKFKVEAGRSTELLEFLRSIQYDGGTDLNSFDLMGIHSDEILLFTDGIQTFGETPTHTFEMPVIPINSSGIADHNFLEYVASASGGVYVNAFNLTGQEISNLLQNQHKSLIEVEMDSEKITEFFPGTGQVLMENFSCVGKVEGARTEITLHFGFGDRITESRSVIIDNTRRISNTIGERIWAQKKLNALLIEGDHSQITEHGKKYSLVTPGTSFIVLDEVQDYVNYEITPPESLQDEYNRLAAQKMKENADNRQERLNRICQEFGSDVEWWTAVDRIDAKKALSNDHSQTPPGEPLMEVMDEQEELLMESSQLEEVVVSGYTAGVRVQQEMESSEEEMHVSPSLRMTKWVSDAAYMNDLKSTDPGTLYQEYLSLVPSNRDNPSFYFDVATYMFQKSQREQGLRVLSNLAELELENTELMRTLGRKLSEFEFHKEAITVFKEVLSLRSFEPHSYIDLGHAYAETGLYQKAIDHLYQVIDNEWDNDILSRFPGIELIVLHDMNNIIHNHRNELEISQINDCLLKNLPLDVRIVIDWDANETDIDLWVTDPVGEKCFFQNKDTRIGGKMSNDITQGYGPEVFRLKNAIEGDYLIQANFFGTRKQTLVGNVTVRAIVYTDFGSENEQKEVLTLQLDPEDKGEHTIGEITFEP